MKPNWNFTESWKSIGRHACSTMQDGQDVPRRTYKEIKNLTQESRGQPIDLWLYDGELQKSFNYMHLLFRNLWMLYTRPALLYQKTRLMAKYLSPHLAGLKTDQNFIGKSSNKQYTYFCNRYKRRHDLHIVLRNNCKFQQKHSSVRDSANKR